MSTARKRKRRVRQEKGKKASKRTEADGKNVFESSRQVRKKEKGGFPPKGRLLKSNVVLFSSREGKSGVKKKSEKKEKLSPGSKRGPRVSEKKPTCIHPPKGKEMFKKVSTILDGVCEGPPQNGGHDSRGKIA